MTRSAQYALANGDTHDFPTSPYSDTGLFFRALQNWAPEYLVSACPFVTCTIVGPAFDNVRAALLFEPGNHGTYLSLLKLVLKRMGTFWSLGQIALGE